MGSPRSSKDERGAVSALFAIFLAPCVVAFLLTLVEFGVVFMQRSSLSSALATSTEQAIELAAHPDAMSDEELQQVITRFMAESGHADATVEVSGSSLEASVTRKGVVSGKSRTIAVHQSAAWLVSSK